MIMVRGRHEYVFLLGRTLARIRAIVPGELLHFLITSSGVPA